MSNQPSLEMPHNGQMLKSMLHEIRMTQQQLSKGLQTNPVNVLRLLDRYSFRTVDFWHISTATGVNMFNKLSILHTTRQPSPEEIALQQRIALLEHENSIYKELLKARLG